MGSDFLFLFFFGGGRGRGILVCFQLLRLRLLIYWTMAAAAPCDYERDMYSDVCLVVLERSFSQYSTNA
jgi:hypothetical protein